MVYSYFLVQGLNFWIVLQIKMFIVVLPQSKSVRPKSSFPHVLSLQSLWNSELFGMWKKWFLTCSLGTKWLLGTGPIYNWFWIPHAGLVCCCCHPSVHTALHLHTLNLSIYRYSWDRWVFVIWDSMSSLFPSLPCSPNTRSQTTFSPLPLALMGQFVALFLLFWTPFKYAVSILFLIMHPYLKTLQCGAHSE